MTQGILSFWVFLALLIIICLIGGKDKQSVLKFTVPVGSILVGLWIFWLGYFYYENGNLIVNIIITILVTLLAYYSTSGMVEITDINRRKRIEKREAKKNKKDA